METKRADLIRQMMEYQAGVGRHSAGTLSWSVLRALAETLPPRPEVGLETGSGNSTILLSNLCDRHLSFTYDDRSQENGSVSYVQNCPLFRAEKTEFVFGLTQETLPKHRFVDDIDVALIDGPHGYPFPELEYYSIYPRLKKGALLIVDDIHIPTVKNMFAVLREDAMFEVVWVKGTTGVLRRTTAPLFDPLGDGWWMQAYNIARIKTKRPPLRSQAMSVLKAVGKLHRKLMR